MLGVVLGGLAGRAGVLAVVDGEEPLLAVVLLLFQPATTKKPISSNTATPAIQPHIPPAVSSRRNTGSLKRGSGSVKRGSVIGHPPSFVTLRVVSKERNPPAVTAVPQESCDGTVQDRVRREPAGQVTRIARRHAAQKTKKNEARNAGRLAGVDQCSTVRPMP